ncbi:MAG: hypothetical protein HY650_06610, partial [Acidobacteria bacterium]|nr:hypothetical protein [Acidobacteriota bacterium]
MQTQLSRRKEPSNAIVFSISTLALFALFSASVLQFGVSANPPGIAGRENPAAGEPDRTARVITEIQIGERRIYGSREGLFVQQGIDPQVTRITNGLPEDVIPLSLEAGTGDGQVIYLGTARDGLFRSENGGMTWEARSAGLPRAIGAAPVVPIESLAISPTDDNEVFVGAETGNIYRSDSGGRNWEALTSGLPGIFHHRTYAPLLLIRPGEPEAVYALVGFPLNSEWVENRLYRLLRPENYWREIKRLPANSRFLSISIDPDDASHLICESDRGVIRIVDWSMQEKFELRIPVEEPVELYRAPGPNSTADQDQGNIAVINDDGTLLEIFNLANRAIEFTPTGAGGYSVASLSASLEAQGSTRLSLADDASSSQALGFNFPFYNVNRTTAFVNSNGNLTFGSGDADSTPSIAEFASGSPRIAPLWNDFNPATTVNPNGVFYRSAAGPTRAIFTWTSVPEFNTTNSNTFQVVLFSDGRIRFTYGAMAAKDGLTGLSNGSSSSFSRVTFGSDLPTVFGSNPILELFNRGLNTRAVAKRFYNSHPDIFDSLVIFGASTHTSSLAGPGSLAMTELVKNQVSGIGLTIFDTSPAYGSFGRLKTMTVMNRLSDFPNDLNERINSTAFSTLDVLGQVAGHQWGSYVRFNDGGLASDSLLNQNRQNWSFFHDTSASVMGGNSWQDNGGGSFTSTDGATGFSLLDQYLAGLLPFAQVQNFFFISNPSNTGGRDRNTLPEIGASLNGTRRNVGISDITAIEGQRSPAFGAAPTSFNHAFILLVPQGQEALSPDLAKIENIRQAWGAYYSTATSGRGSIVSSLVVPTDLVVSSVSVSPTTITAGNNVAVSFTINNNGSVAAGATTSQIVLSTDSTITAGDTFLFSINTPALAAFASSSQNVNVNIPPGTPPGAMFIGVITDAGNAVGES